MKFDMAYVNQPITNPFFNPIDEIEIDDLRKSKNSLKSITKFFTFEAPTDIEWAWELESDMIYPERDC